MIILYNHHMTDHNITMKTLGWDIYDRKHKYGREKELLYFLSGNIHVVTSIFLQQWCSINLLFERSFCHHMMLRQVSSLV